MPTYLDETNLPPLPGPYLAVIVGSGFYGLTMAERITEESGRPVLVIERRSAIGGNARSETDLEAGIEVHNYGPHIFHTSNERVWNYVKRFTDFNDYRHHVWSSSEGELFPLPVSLATISAVAGRQLAPQEARNFIAETRVPNSHPNNFEEKALDSVGSVLYERFFKGYTQKQWQLNPKELPAEIFGRLPVRFDLNTRYFSDTYEGIPTDGYAEWIDRMAASELIHVALNTDWKDIREQVMGQVKVIYTGPIDEFFDNQFGRLSWRTLDFEFERVAVEDFQGAAQINYPDVAVAFTRIVEYRHFHPERKLRKGHSTIISREFSRLAKEDDEPYYPVRSPQDREILSRYRAAIEDLPSVHFGGRLGTYQYLDMHMAIASALTNFGEIREEIRRWDNSAG